MVRHIFQSAVACVVMTWGAAAVAGVVAGHVDDFEDGTTQGWSINLLGQGSSTFAPVNVASGGPSGVDDNYLLLTSIGVDGPGSRLTAFNVGDAWQGDYAALGIGSIRLHARNLGNSDLALRLLVANPGSGPPTDSAFSSTALSLPAGGGWTLLEFSLDPHDLTAGVGSVAGALADVTMLRLFHSSTAGFPGEAIVAQLGIDNVFAVGSGGGTVPEPASWLLATTALFGLRLARRRGRSITSAAHRPSPGGLTAPPPRVDRSPFGRAAGQDRPAPDVSIGQTFMRQSGAPTAAVRPASGAAARRPRGGSAGRGGSCPGRPTAGRLPTPACGPAARGGRARWPAAPARRRAGGP